MYVVCGQVKQTLTSGEGASEAVVSESGIAEWSLVSGLAVPSDAKQAKGNPGNSISHQNQNSAFEFLPLSTTIYSAATLQYSLARIRTHGAESEDSTGAGA